MTSHRRRRSSRIGAGRCQQRKASPPPHSAAAADEGMTAAADARGGLVVFEAVVTARAVGAGIGRPELVRRVAVGAIAVAGLGVKAGERAGGVAALAGRWRRGAVGAVGAMAVRAGLGRAVTAPGLRFVAARAGGAGADAARVLVVARGAVPVTRRGGALLDGVAVGACGGGPSGLVGGAFVTIRALLVAGRRRDPGGDRAVAIRA